MNKLLFTVAHDLCFVRNLEIRLLHFMILSYEFCCSCRTKSFYSILNDFKYKLGIFAGTFRHDEDIDSFKTKVSECIQRCKDSLYEDPDPTDDFAIR